MANSKDNNVEADDVPVSADNQVAPENVKDYSNKLKKAMFGGYDKASVDEYLTMLEKNNEIIKTQLQDEINSVIKEKIQVAQECKDLRTRITKIEHEFLEYKTKIAHKSLNDLQREAFDTVTQEIDEQKKDIERQRKSLENAEKVLSEKMEWVQKQENELRELAQSSDVKMLALCKQLESELDAIKRE